MSETHWFHFLFFRVGPVLERGVGLVPYGERGGCLLADLVIEVEEDVPLF